MLHLCRWTAWRVVLDLNVIHDTQKHPKNSYATTLKSLNVSETLLFRHVVHRNLQRLRPMLDFYVALVMSLRRIGLAKCWDVKDLPWVMSFIAPNVWNQTKSWSGVCKLGCNNLGYMAFLQMGVSKNSGTPKTSILIGFSIINHPFGGAHPYFWKHPYLWVVWFHVPWCSRFDSCRLDFWLEMCPSRNRDTHGILRLSILKLWTSWSLDGRAPQSQTERLWTKRLAATSWKFSNSLGGRASQQCAGGLDKIFVLVVVSNIFYFHPYLGKIPILTNIFQKGLKPPTSCV